jgi:hypothetical protein
MLDWRSPFAHVAQEIRLPSGEIPDEKPRRVKRLRSIENTSGPDFGAEALYLEISTHTGTLAKSLSSGHTACWTAPPTFSK